MIRALCLTLMLSLAGSGIAQSPPAPAQHSSHAPSHAAPSAAEIWDSLMAGNRRFVAGKPLARDLVSLRHKLVSGQSPKAIILSCSDSRVGPELIFDQGLGDLFVVRTAGNVADAVALGSIEYAVDHLHSTVLVVLGHQKCGAVNAACSGEKMPSPNLEPLWRGSTLPWLKRKVMRRLMILSSRRSRKTFISSASDLLANSEIIRDAVKSGKLTVIEAEYELDAGRMVRLNAPASAHN